MELILENIPLFAGILSVIVFFSTKRKGKWKILLFAVICFAVAIKSKINSQPDGRLENENKSIMKDVNIYNDLEYIKQKLGNPIKKHPQGVDGSLILEWNLKGLNIMLYHDKSENIEWIEYTLSPNTNSTVDIYSPKGFKLFNIGLGELKYKDLINYSGSNVSELVFNIQYKNHLALYSPVRYEIYQGRLSETEYVNLFYFNEVICAEDFSIEKLMDEKVRSLRIELTSWYEMFDDHMNDSGPLKNMITQDSLYRDELFVNCDY